MQAKVNWLAPLVGGLGVATWWAHSEIDPGASAGGVAAISRAVLDVTAFVPLAILFSVLLAGTWLALARSVARAWDVECRDVESALVPLILGLGLPLVATIMDVAAFWCTAPPLAALGLGLGVITSAYSLLRLRPQDGAPEQGKARSQWDRLLIAALAVAIPLALLPSWSRPGGDEPHYLVVAHSIWYDGSLDLADDYAARVYEPYHPDALAPHTKPGRARDSRHSMHGVGLPLILLPAYIAGRQVSGGLWMVALPRALLVALYGLFAWCVFGLIADIAGRRAARAGTAATVLLAPLLYAPLFLFPAVPAMLFACAGYRGARSARSVQSLFLSGLALAALPWIGVKFIPLAVTIIAVTLLREMPIARAKRALITATPLAVTLAMHTTLMWVLYGTLSPASAYLGAPTSGSTVPAMGANWGAYLAEWPGAVATLIGYFIDQKDGLLAYGPHLILAAAGVPWLWRQRRRDLLALTAVLFAYVGPYALSQQLSGQGPPVRPLLAILWVLSPALGIALTLSGRENLPFAAARGALLSLAATLTMVFASRPELLPHDYPVKSSRLLRAYAPYGADWWHLFPQWVNVEEARWGVALAWAILAAMVVVALARAGSNLSIGAENQTGRFPIGWLSAALTLVLLCGFVLVHHSAVTVTGLHRSTEIGNGLTAWVQEESPVHTWAEFGGVWQRPGRAGHFLLTSARPFVEVDVELGSLTRSEVAVDFHGGRADGSARPDAPLTATLGLNHGWRSGETYAYHCRLWAERGISPAIRGGSRDERLLGVFLRIARLGFSDASE